MQILRPERTGTQDDSVAMGNRNDLRIEFLQSVAKDLALPAQGKLREESRSVHFHGNARFFLRYAQDRSPRRPPQNDSPDGFFRSLDSRGEAAVVNASARASGRQSRLP